MHISRSGRTFLVVLLAVGLMASPEGFAQNCAPPPGGLVSWWPGNGNANDIVGGNNGTVVGNVTYVTGEVGQAFSFNGNQEAVNVGSPANLQLQNFTIDAWIQRASTNQASLQSGGGVIFSYGSGFTDEYGGYGIGLEDNGQIFLSQIGTSEVVSTASVTDTNWHHVAVTTSYGIVVFYLDGVAYPAGFYGTVYFFGLRTAAIGAVYAYASSTLSEIG